MKANKKNSKSYKNSKNNRNKKKVANDKVRESARVETEKVDINDMRLYLSESRRRAFMTALGIALIIFSFSIPMFISGLKIGSGSGTAGMLIMVILAIVLFQYYSMIFRKWENVKAGNFVTDDETKTLIKGECSGYRLRHVRSIIIGSVFLIISIFPTYILNAIDMDAQGIDLNDVGGAIVFLLVAIGVLFIVRSSLINKYLNGLVRSIADDDEDIYEYISPTAELVMSVFWPTVLCIYLSWSFISFRWILTCLIWPLAFVVRVVLKGCLRKLR